MYVHITHRSNLQSIKDKGLVPGRELNKPHLMKAPDRDKVSLAYLEDEIKIENLRELRNAILKGKVVNPIYSDYQEKDLIILEVDCSTAEFIFEERPAEMFAPFTTLSESFYNNFKGYAKTNHKIPWDCLKIIDL